MQQVIHVELSESDENDSDGDARKKTDKRKEENKEGMSPNWKNWVVPIMYEFVENFP